MNTEIKTLAPTKINSFIQLDAWREGHRLVLMIYDIIKDFPSEERFGLADQMRRSAVSVTSNIAEGFRRKTAKDKRQFYRTSLSSLTELQNQLIIAKDVCYLKKESFQKIAEQTTRVGKLVNGIIRSAKGYQ